MSRIRAAARLRGAALAVLGAAALAVLGAGCGGHATAIPATTGGSGCGTSYSAGSAKLAVTIGGHRRLVIVHLPTGYTGKRKLALVLNMHGSESTAAAQEAFTGMDAAADADHFIVAYPQALIRAGAGFDWNVPKQPLIGGGQVPAGSADDVTFLTRLVGVLEHRYCVNHAEVYATGFSGGARMASQLGCDASGTFAAVAPVSGLRKPTPCPAGRAVPVIAFHGTADLVDPYNGNGQPYWTYSVPQAANLWARQDSCTGRPASQAGAGYTVTSYHGCADGATVELYTITGEGHEWPGGPKVAKSLTSVLGPQSSAVRANAVMWAFFMAHPMQ